MNSRYERKQHKKPKRKRIVLFLLMFVLLLGLAWGGATYYSFHKAMDKMNNLDGQGSGSAADPGKIPHLDPFSVLLLGIDERENDNGRTDTMIVVTVNPDLGTIKLLSIPRDSRVEIVGNGTVEKINHAYTRGGIDMSIDTVEQFLDIPIDYFVSVNMEGFLDIIDVLDGITVDNNMDLAHGKYSFPKGKITLNGKEALVFSRIRYGDPRGDFGRQVRQKQLIEAIVKKAANPKIVLQLDDIFDVLGDNVKTNFRASQLMNLQKLYSKVNGHFDQIQFEKGTGETIGKYWYYIHDETELAEKQAELKAHLEIE